jgi:hypothetical protein
MKLIRRLLARHMRYKMLVAAMAVAAIIGAIGLLGFRYIIEVARTVSVTTEHTSPLLARGAHSLGGNTPPCRHGAGH